MTIFNSSRSPRPSRVQTITTDTAVVVNTDIYDVIDITALATACTFTLSGTPIDWQKLTISIKDSGGPHNLTWTGDWSNQNIALPANTGAASRRTVLEFVYSASAAKWLLVSYLTSTPDSITASGAITGASLSAGSGTVTCGTLTASVGASIPRRVMTSNNQTSVTPTADTDIVNVTSVNGAGTFTFNNPTGSPTPWQEMTIYLKHTGTNALAWGDAYVAGQNALYTAIVSAKMMYMTFAWDPTISKWFQRIRATTA